METTETKKKNNYVKNITIIAIFSALAGALSFVKIPSPIGSIALDSSPGYFVSGFYSPLLGGITGTLGHLVSAWIAGLPLSVVHIPIAILQFCWCWVFGMIIRKMNSMTGLIFASIIAIIANGVVAPIILSLIYPAMKDMMYGLISFLTIASSINVIVAAISIKILSKLNIPGL